MAIGMMFHINISAIYRYLDTLCKDEKLSFVIAHLYEAIGPTDIIIRCHLTWALQNLGAKIRTSSPRISDFKHQAVAVWFQTCG